MKRILFAHSYFLQLDPKQWKAGQPYAPLGTLYAAALMRENNFEVMVQDMMFAHSPDEIVPYIEKYQPDYFVIYDDGFNYLTKMCLTNMRQAAFKMVRLAKENNCIVIISSSDATDQHEQYLNAGADFILMGEAEFTLLELVQALTNNVNDFSAIQGLSFKKENEIIRTPKRAVLKDLDSLPLPAWDLIDIEPYREMWMKHAGYFSMNITTTRGCPFKCNWCAKPIYGNRYNVRSPKRVVQELDFLKDKYGFDHIWFCDDIFGLKPGWVAEFADIVQLANLKLSFKIQSRADLLVQENYVQALAKAGCDNVWLGAESGSQKILDAMDKGITVEQIHQATHLLKKHHIKPSFFIQFGYPGETKDDIALTIKMINQLLPHEIGISVSYPLPGTVFYENVKAQLKEKTNWADSDDLALLFKNTYPPSFYKRLHRYVHHSFKAHRGKAALRQALQSPLALKKKDWKTAISTFWYAPKQIVDGIQLNCNA